MERFIAEKLRNVSLLIVVLSVLLAGGCGGGSIEHKHVVLLTVDTLRPDYLGVYGYDLPTSPCVDRMFSSGTHFTHALTPVPRTTQALGSMLTGCYPHTTGLRMLLDTLSTDVVSIAQLAKQKGYKTVAVVSNHVLGPERELNRGFDIYDFAGDIRDAAHTTNAVIRHLEMVDSDEPLFVWVHYIDPHVPYYPPKKLAREFDPDYRGPYRDNFGEVHGGIGNQAYPPDLGKQRAVFRNDLPDSVNAHVRRLYAADIRASDDAIEMLLEWMQNKFGNDWVVMFASDHGESLGEHDFFYDHGDYVYNASLRVPLGFTFPEGHELHGARVVDEWVSIMDVMPTFVELLDLELPDDLSYGIEGKSLVPYFRGDTNGPRTLFAECGRSYFRKMIRRRVSFDVFGRFRAVVRGEWKLIWTPGLTQDAYELYNVYTDPHETVNVYDENKETANELVGLLEKWITMSDDDKPRDLTDDERKLLRSLGYVQ